MKIFKNASLWSWLGTNANYQASIVVLTFLTLVAAIIFGWNQIEINSQLAEISSRQLALQEAEIPQF